MKEKNKANKTLIIKKLVKNRGKRKIAYSLTLFVLLMAFAPAKEANAAMADATVKSLINEYVSDNTSNYTINGYFYYESYMSKNNETYNKTYYENGKGKWADATPKNVNDSFYTPDKSASGGLEMGITTDWGFLPTSASWEAALNHIHGAANPTRADYIRRVKQGYSRTKTTPQLKGITVTDYAYKSGTNYWVKPNATVEVQVHGYQQYPGTKYQMDDYIKNNNLRLYNTEVDARATMSNGGVASYFRTDTELDVTKNTYSRTDGNRNLYTTFNVKAKEAGKSYQLQSLSTSVNGKEIGYTASGSYLKTDGVLPSGSFSPNSSTWNNSNVVVSFNPSDSQSGVKRWRWRTSSNNGSTYGGWSAYVVGDTASNITVSATASNKLQVQVEDNVGSVGTVTSGTYQIDKTDPTGTIAGNPSAWTNDDVILTLTASDAGGSSYYRTLLPNGTYSTSTTPTYTVSSNGTYKFTVYDDAGNSTEISPVVSKIDKTAPGGTITGNPTAWTNQSASLSITATDSGGAAVKSITKPDGTVATGITTTYTATANGTYNFVVTDNAGNTKTVSASVTKIDKTLPSGTATGNPTNWTNTNATLTFNATNTGGSGIKSIEKPDGTTVNTSSTTYSVSANGTYDFVVTDNAGNTKTVSIVVNRIDKTTPSGTIAGNPTAWTNANATLTLSATDAGGAGVESITKPDGTVVLSSTTAYTVTANGTYNFVVTDNAGNTKTVSVVVNRIDKTVPGGTITGNPTAWTNANATLTLSATDSGGAGVASVTKPDGTVVSGATTTYTATANGTYNFVVTDNAGNKTTVSAIVTKIDKSLPDGTITGNPTAWTNANATLTINATDAGGAGVKSITKPDGTVVSSSTTSYTATANGTYNFVVTDNAGNTKAVSVSVTKIDKIIPNGAITGNPTAWTNATVTLSISATDTGGAGVKSITKPDGVVVNGASTTFSAIANGTYNFVVTDNAGNTKTVSASVTKIDKTLPSGTAIGNPTVWTNGNATLTFTATDAGGSGFKSITKPDGTVVTTASTTYTATANGTFNFVVTDNAGNTKTVSIVVNKIDKSLPTLSIVQTPTAWTNGTVTLTATGSDIGGAGVKSIALPNGTLVNGLSGSQVITANGTYSFKVTDNAGNVTSKSITVSNIDKSLPSGTITGNPTAWTNQNATLTINATDIGGSGVKSITKPDNTIVTTASTTYTATANGTYTFVVADNAGNTKTVSIVVSKIDKSLPGGAITGNPTSWTNQNVTLSISATDTGGSGVKSITKPDNTIVTTTSTTYTATANGTFSFVVTDNAGNTKTESITVSKIDKVIPTLILSQNPTAWTNGNVTVSAKGTDSGGSNVKSIQLPNGNVVSGGTASEVVTTNGTYSFILADNAGNTVTQSLKVSNIDKVKPVIVKTEVLNVTQESFDVYIYGVVDAHSGINRVAFPTWTAAGGQDDLEKDWTTHANTRGTDLGNGTWKYTVQRSQHNYEFGDYMVHIYVYDNAGNVTTAAIQYLLRDQVKPTINVTGNPTAWTKNDVILTVNASDVHTGVKNITLPDGTVVVKNGGKGETVSHNYTITESGSYTFIVTDMYDNTISQTVNVTKIDKTNPTGIITPSIVKDWTNKDVTLAVKATDAGSGVKSIELPNGTVTIGAIASINATKNGDYSFVITDNVGNKSTIKQTVSNIDKVVSTEGTVQIQK